MDQPGMSQVDKVVRQCLYWPDGTRKKLIDERRDWMRQLVQALLDKYNDYNHLLGVCSLSLPPSLIRCPVARVVLLHGFCFTHSCNN